MASTATGPSRTWAMPRACCTSGGAPCSNAYMKSASAPSASSICSSTPIAVTRPADVVLMVWTSCCCAAAAPGAGTTNPPAGSTRPGIARSGHRGRRTTSQRRPPSRYPWRESRPRPATPDPTRSHSMSAQITVHVAESERSVPEQTTAGELFDGDRSVLVARVNGELRDLAHVLADGDVVEPVTAGEQDGLDVLRHSAAHVLAQAVQEVHPDARLGIGPPIRDGFYYDFDVETPFTPDDLKALEKVMQRIVNEGQTFVRREVSDDEARAELSAEPYKLELIGLKGNASDAAEGADAEVGGGQLTIYDNLRR